MSDDTRTPTGLTQASSTSASRDLPLALPDLISLSSDAIAHEATRLSDEDLVRMLERVRLLYHQHKIFLSELIHRDPPRPEKLAWAEQSLAEYGALFQALKMEERRRCR